MFWQLWVTFGIFLGYAANLAVKVQHSGSSPRTKS